MMHPTIKHKEEGWEHAPDMLMRENQFYIHTTMNANIQGVWSFE